MGASTRKGFVATREKSELSYLSTVEGLRKDRYYKPYIRTATFSNVSCMPCSEPNITSTLLAAERASSNDTP